MLRLNRPSVAILTVTLILALCAGIFYAGYQAGRPYDLLADWRADLERQRAAINEADADAQRHMNALAMRLGRMQAEVDRLDALGQRLVNMTDLDLDEFDFSSPPALGGPEASQASAIELPDFMAQMGALAQRIEDREQQLTVLENILWDQSMLDRVLPAGAPVRNAWISSPFGRRTDPFTGLRDFHSGVDFAGQRGDKVQAVADGIVSIAERRDGYGNLVEINHGNGYATRYAHCMRLLVKVGDTVIKGENIALMGTTGRSTGPHLHFEVLHDGVAVNPRRYLNADNGAGTPGP